MEIAETVAFRQIFLSRRRAFLGFKRCRTTADYVPAWKFEVH